MYKRQEWDAPITHTKFTVTYEAKINKEPADTNQFVNVATAKGSNTDEVKDCLLYTSRCV